MLSFEERQALLEQALSSIQPNELISELHSEEAAGPTVSQFFCKTPTYVMLPKSCAEQTFESLKTIRVNDSKIHMPESVYKETYSQREDFALAA